MKTLFKVLIALLVLTFALLFILPLIFEGKIEDLARKEINKNVNARVDFADIDLSLFKSFPHFNLGIYNLSVIGKGAFENDTLALVENISITLDLFSVFKGDAYEIRKLAVNSPDIKLRILDDGRTNYEISLPSKTSTETVEENEAAFNLILSSVKIVNGSLMYLDEESDIQAYITGLDSKISGGLSEDATILRTNTSIGSLTVGSEGINYLTNSKLRYQANIDADIKNEIYTLGQNELVLNDLLLIFNGSVSFVQEDINLVLTFDAPKNEFKSLLSLVPAMYLEDFSSLEANGIFSMGGTVKGIYNEEKLPAFDINMSVENGFFKYPDLPKSVENITIEADISNPGGDVDATYIDISQFDMNMGGNPVFVSLKMKTPVSDPDINGKFKGEIDLATVKDFYPLEEDEDLLGAMVFDVTLKGKLSSIENEQYDKFIAMGTMLLKDMSYSSASFTQAFTIPHAHLNFSPQYIDLVSFKMKNGNSDLHANGKLENYLSYVFADGKLKGQMSMESKYFNLDELMGESEENTEEPQDEKEEDADIASSSVIEIPNNLDFTLSSSFDKLVYDKLEMKNVTGKVIVRDEALQLINLKSNIIDGQMTVNGTYSTKELVNPKVDFGINLLGIDIPSAYDNFAVIRKYMPLAKKTKGKLSADFTFKSSLDNEMMPVYEGLNGKGQISSTEIMIDGLNTLVKIADALYFDDLKKLELNKVLVAFQFINGKMLTKPFNLNYKNVNTEVQGWTALDQSIGYVMAMEIPTSELGSEASNLLDGLAKEAEKLGLDYELPETIKVGVSIGGTLSKPKITTDLKQSSSDLVKKAKDAIIEEARKELQQQSKKILDDADKAAKKIMAEANKQADALRKSADNGIAELNKETDKQANALMEEAKKQGLLAELAAQEVVKKLRSEADTQIKGLRTEADKKADALLKEAKKQSDKIRKDAKKESDALLKK